MTRNTYGRGDAYYIAARTGKDFLDDFYGKLCQKLDLTATLDTKIPMGVSVQSRTDGEFDYIFLLNFTECYQEINAWGDQVVLEPWGSCMIKRKCC